MPTRPAAKATRFVPVHSRNHAFRAELAARWPLTTFTVGYGRDQRAEMWWTDGPAISTVETALARLDSHGMSWGVSASRTHSLALTAVGYLRARTAGRGDELLDGALLTGANSQARPASWPMLAWNIDAGSVSAEEWSLARSAVALAQLPTQVGASTLALALFLSRHGFVLDAVHAPAA